MDLGKQFEQLRRQHRVAVLAAFALLDADEHALAVDSIGFDVRDLRHVQAGAIGHIERAPVLDARAASSSGATSSTLSTSGNFLGRGASTSLRDRSGRSSVTPKRKRNADTVAPMTDSLTPCSRRCNWKRRTSSAVAVSGERLRNAAKARMSAASH